MRCNGAGLAGFANGIPSTHTYSGTCLNTTQNADLTCVRGSHAYSRIHRESEISGQNGS